MHGASSRFVLTRDQSEGVLLDLETGDFYRLNEAACEVADALEAGIGPEQIAARLAARYGIERDAAARDVASVLERLAERRAPVRRNPVTFVSDRGGYTMRWDESPVLWVDREGRQVRRDRSCAGVDALGAAAPTKILTWALPHLLTLRGRAVLHASSVVRANQVFAFSGGSGAGKTTLAGALGVEGGSLVSEDLLPLAFEGGAPVVRLDAERALRRWVEAKTRALASDVPFVIDTADLEGVAATGAGGGGTAPLAGLFFLDPSLRAGDAIRAEPVGRSTALMLLFENAFAEIGTRAVWIQALELSRALAQAIPIARLTIPDGLPQLHRAAAAFGGILDRQRSTVVR